MSISIQGRTGWASIPNSIGRSRLPYPTLSLLINLLTHSEGFSASYELIQEQTGMASATVSTAIKNLEKLGLLTVKKMPRTGGKYASNHYIFHADNIWKLTPEFVDQRLDRKKTASGKKDGKKSPTSVSEDGTASLNEDDPLQEMKTKNDQGETPWENDHPPAGQSDADASEGSNKPDPGKGRSKDKQAFGEAYGSIEPLTSQNWGELSRVWSQMLKSGELPTQEELLDGLRVYYRAVQHNRRTNPSFRVKRPANWLRDCMWLSTEDELKIPGRGDAQGGSGQTYEGMAERLASKMRGNALPGVSGDVVEGEVVGGDCNPPQAAVGALFGRMGELA